MKKKLLHLLFVFLLATFMISLKNTCSMAYTWEEFSYFINDYSNHSGLNSDTINLCQWFIRNKSAIANKIGTSNLELYTNFYMCRSYSSSDGEYTNHLYCFNTDGFNYSMSSLYVPNQGNKYHLYAYQSNNFNTLRGAVSTSQINISSQRGGCGLLTKEINGGVYPADSYFQNNYTPPSTFIFHFYDESVTATAPNGETAYCVFLNNLTDIQPIGYIENFEDHTNTQITIFMQNYRDADNVKVETLQPTDYMLVNGELWVKTITMWSPMVYEIVGIDNGPSGDFLNGQNFTAYYYIAAGSNTSGDPNFYGTPPGYDDNQFFLWKLLGSFGDGSGDPGSGLFGGLGNLFIPDKDFFVNYFNTFNDWFSNHLGLLYTPFELVFDILERISQVDFSDPQMSFGPYILPLSDDAVLVPLTTIHFNDFLEDETFEEIHNIYLVIIDGLIVCGLLYMLYCKYEEIVGGKNQ